MVIIGILSSLAYSSMFDLIFSNRAKETAQTMRTFAERALAEGKRQGKAVEIKLSDNNITYSLKNSENENFTLAKSEALSSGFSANTADNSPPNCIALNNADNSNFNEGITAEPTIGVSGITAEGYFFACGYKDYCGAAVKTKELNSFIACIKRGASATWERL